MATKAEIVEVACRDCQAISFYGGYGTVLEMVPGGGWVSRTVHFPQGKCVAEKRNEAGRCTRCEMEYDDGSVLVFTWSPTRSDIKTHNHVLQDCVR